MDPGRVEQRDDVAGRDRLKGVGIGTEQRGHRRTEEVLVVISHGSLLCFGAQGDQGQGDRDK